MTKIKPFPGILKKVKRSYVFTDEQLAWFKWYYPRLSNGKIIECMKISETTMLRLVRKHSLKKSKWHLRQIRLRAAKKTRETCEKNGYYDRLRGGCPSQETLEGVKRMWQDVKEGKREHPYKILQRKDPEKYKELCKHNGECKREQIRKDRMRVIYGMKRLTKMFSVVVQPYTKSQLYHRARAIRRGYILNVECAEGTPDRYKIFYDEHTHRNAKFESNCIKDGFKIEVWED